MIMSIPITHVPTYTFGQIKKVCINTDPKFTTAFVKTCYPFGLNGVYMPFLRDRKDADPSLFVTPNALHTWHKFIFDHTLKWIINIMGGQELDHCMP